MRSRHATTIRPRLIITADDYGLHQAVNEAVERGYRDGVLQAASLMVAAPAVADAVERAIRLPGLAVGLHLVLADGRAMLPPARIPDLVDAQGMFDQAMLRNGFRYFFLPRVRRQLAAEIRAQFEAFAATGLSLDHVNAHKHFHLHPTIAGLILKVGPRFGLRAVRAPLEPGAPLRRTDPETRVGGDPAALFARTLRARLRAAGLLAPDQVFGLRWSGAMTEPRLAGVIRALPPGLSEIYLHPATRNDFEGAAPGYRYAEELAALTSSAVSRALSESGARLGGFADFAP